MPESTVCIGHLKRPSQPEHEAETPERASLGIYLPSLMMAGQRRCEVQHIRFTKSAPWCCPSYKDYYIQGRPSGRDVHGNDTYEYALFRKQPFQVIQRFRTRKHAYEYMSRLTGFTRWDIKNGSSGIIINDRQYLGVIYNGAMYRITRRTREVATRPVDDEQLTHWHMKYIDCLSEAKEIIQSKELKA